MVLSGGSPFREPPLFCVFGGFFYLPSLPSLKFLLYPFDALGGLFAGCAWRGFCYPLFFS